MTIDAFQLYGTRLFETPPVRLRAGKLEADLVNGNLRTIRYGGTEVLRAISYLVRDRDWGTYSPEIADLRIEQSDDRFEVAYLARCEGPDDTKLIIDVHITGNADRLAFEAEAIAATGFETNRCGFCILHPIVGVAGSPATVEHVAERDQSLVGFQSLSLYGDPPKGFADIATFARLNPRTPGVGSALFPATRAAAEEFGLEFINATIRADNFSGLGYYAKMGFETYDRLVQVPLQDGTSVDRIKKRFRVGARHHTIPDA